MQCSLRYLPGILLAASFISQQALASDPEATVSGRDQFVQSCGICHLENGQGVPGAFPPLDDRLARWASSEHGRTYLVRVITNGLFGSIDVGGVQYAGAMPPMAQLGSAEIAGILNHVLTELAGAGGELAFTEPEVSRIREQAEPQPTRSLRPES